jgi:hypothetical protein
MTDQPGRQDFGTLAGTDKQSDMDEISGLDQKDVDEGIRDDAGDQADAIETVDDLTGSTDYPEPGGPPGLGRDDHK